VPKESFKEFINDYSAAVLNTATRVLGEHSKAQDVHQEVFLAIWRRWHKFNGKTNWPAYLYRTTVRKAIEFAARSKTEPLADQQIESSSARDNPEGPLRAAELQRKLTLCLARLPKRQADVFVLSRIEGLAHKEIAEILGCSQRTVGVHLHRALKRLANELRDYLDTD